MLELLLNDDVLDSFTDMLLEASYALEYASKNIENPPDMLIMYSKKLKDIVEILDSEDTSINKIQKFIVKLVNLINKFRTVNENAVTTYFS